MIRSFICAAAFLMLAACNTSSEKIEVTGRATMKVIPDMVDLSLKVGTVKPAMKDAVRETQQIVNDVVNVCKKYVPVAEDIKVSHTTTYKSYDYSRNTPVFKGYGAGQVLQVTLKNINELEKFTEELLATKVSSIDNIRYNHSKADSLQRVVNLLALADARQTAVKMCEKMDVKLGKTIYLSNYQKYSDQMTNDVYAGRADFDVNLYSKGFGGSGFRISAEILEFVNLAYASFEIE